MLLVISLLLVLKMMKVLSLAAPGSALSTKTNSTPRTANGTLFKPTTITGSKMDAGEDVLLPRRILTELDMLPLPLTT